MILCGPLLTACGTDNARPVSIPPELQTCAADPAAPALPAQDWSDVLIARAIQEVRDALTLDYVLGLRSAAGDCRAKVAGVRAFDEAMRN